jgi:hypothetical protein
LSSNLTLGRKYHPAYGGISLLICWKNWNLLWTHNLCLGVYHFYSIKVSKIMISCCHFLCLLSFQRVI